MVRKHKVDLLLLQETKICRDVENVIFNVWGSRGCEWEWVPSDGASGGLIAIWRESSLGKLDAMKSPRALCNKFISLVDNFSWSVANIYRPNEEQERWGFCYILSTLHASWDVPWCFGGDFNMIGFAHERRGGRVVHRSMERFSRFIKDNELIDLPLKFTWSNNQVSAMFNRID